MNLKQGDIVIVDFSPTKGHEQKGKRPALVISNTEYNRALSMPFVCPITSTSKGGPFEVEVNAGKTKGVALINQLRSIDAKARKVVLVDMADGHTVHESIRIAKLILS